MDGTRMIQFNVETMTEDEQQVFAVLEKQAKERMDAIARKCGFSRQKVWKIVKDLEKKKIIWGYGAVTGPKEKDLQMFILLLRRSIVPLDPLIKQQSVKGLLDEIRLKNVIIDDVYFTHGQYDGVITFSTDDLLSARRFLTELSKRIGVYFDQLILLECLFPFRRLGFKNPHMEDLVELL
jgi:DNA-binding Lrp family transcriptional regulator